MCSIVLELLDDVVHPLDDHLGVLGGEDQARAEPATGRASRNLSYMNLVSMYYLMVLVRKRTFSREGEVDSPYSD